MLNTTEALQPAAELARERLTLARKRLVALRGKAEKSLRQLASRGRAQGKELSVIARRLRPAGKVHLSRWHNRLLQAAGVATWGQVRQISRELTRISKKLDALSSTK